MRRDHSEEVQIKGESVPGICIIAGFRSTGCNLGTSPAAAPCWPGGSARRGGCRPCSREDRREACPRNEIRGWPCPERGAGTRLRCPTAGNPRGLRRVRGQAVPGCPGAAAVVRWCRWGSAPCSHSATSAAPSQRAASPAAGGWLPARRLALPSASGDKGIKRHARSAGRGWGRHLAPASRSPRTPPPPPAPPAPRRCPRPAPAAGGTGRARGRSLFP